VLGGKAWGKGKVGLFRVSGKHGVRFPVRYERELEGGKNVKKGRKTRPGDQKGKNHCRPAMGREGKGKKREVLKSAKGERDGASEEK